MLRQISISLFIFFVSVCAFAQTEKYNAPVRWERYKVSENEVSILFPKLPTLIAGGDVCRQEETNKYAAFAENVVYGLNITFKTKKKIPSLVCPENKKFDETNFDDRLKHVKVELKNEKETKFNQNGLEVIKIEGEFFVYWLIDDFGNKRWFELWTTDTSNTNASVKNFIEALKIEKSPAGIEIAKGSPATLGDETPVDKPDANSEKTATGGKDTNVRLIIKPRASYTDGARQSQTVGTVSLRVTFLASGGIGSIEIVKALPFGLTEQSIAAARKMVFIPATKNGTPVSVSKMVEYSFSLY